MIKKALKASNQKGSSSEGEDLFLIHCRARLPFLPLRQFRFHPSRKWTFDFAWPDHKIAVEVEGGLFIRGRHSRGKGYENDMCKYNHATLMGWKVYRFSTDQVKKGEAIDFVSPLFL
jgi:very-short-patch-repair endonuclease